MKSIDRLKKYIEYKGISLNAFDLSIEASNGYIGRMIKNKGSLGSDVIEKIYCTYPDLNLIWLMTGKGDMLITENKPEAENYYSEKNITNYVSDSKMQYKSEIDYKDKYILQLEENLKQLLADNKQKSEIIQGFLEGKITKID